MRKEQVQPHPEHKEEKALNDAVNSLVLGSFLESRAPDNIPQPPYELGNSHLLKVSIVVHDERF